MRTIKFRGKSIETGEWLYGDLWRRQQNGQGTIYTFITHTGGRIERVDPDTVGQFTGLSDKNKEEIYEDDIIRDEISVRNANPSTGMMFHGGTEKIGPVIFSDIHHAYIINYPPKRHIDQWESMHGREHNLEVIGNIHENPELLNKLPK